MEVHLTVEGRELKVTNADRMIFPGLGVTKAEVVRYFVTVGPAIVDAVKDRPTMLERWRTGEGFYQRRPPRGTPGWVQTARFGEELARRMPELATTERLKRDRGARVSVDTGPLTVASAHSIRPTPQALVSMPLEWDELGDADPAAFDVRIVAP